MLTVGVRRPDPSFFLVLISDHFLFYVFSSNLQETERKYVILKTKKWLQTINKLTNLLTLLLSRLFPISKERFPGVGLGKSSAVRQKLKPASDIALSISFFLTG